MNLFAFVSYIISSSSNYIIMRRVSHRLPDARSAGDDEHSLSSKCSCATHFLVGFSAVSLNCKS